MNSSSVLMGFLVLTTLTRNGIFLSASYSTPSSLRIFKALSTSILRVFILIHKTLLFIAFNISTTSSIGITVDNLSKSHLGYDSIAQGSSMLSINSLILGKSLSIAFLSLESTLSPLSTSHI